MNSWYRWDGQDLLLKLKLQPKSCQDAFAGIQNDRLRVRITAPPVDGKANNHLLAWLAVQVGVSKSSVAIESGRSSQLKRVRVKTPERFPDIIAPPRSV
jgi:uncharacterized protein (TIGR00251 family)